MNSRNGNNSGFDCGKKLEKVLVIQFCMVLSHSPWSYEACQVDGMELVALNTSQSNFQNWGCVISGVSCGSIALDSVTTSSRLTVWILIGWYSKWDWQCLMWVVQWTGGWSWSHPLWLYQDLKVLFGEVGEDNFGHLICHRKVWHTLRRSWWVRQRQ